MFLKSINTFVLILFKNILEKRIFYKIYFNINKIIKLLVGDLLYHLILKRHQIQFDLQYLHHESRLI